MNKVYIVLPKQSTFLFKEYEEQIAVQTKVQKIIGKLQELPVRFTCFTEDFLALRLFLGQAEIDWISAVAKSDQNFILTDEPHLPEDYKKMQKYPVNEMLIRAVSRKIKPPGITPGSVLPVQYKELRRRVLRERIRKVCDTVLSEAQFVVYFDAANGYCADPSKSSEVGDGKIRICVNLTTGFEFYYIGGCPVDESVFYDALQVLMRKGAVNADNL